MFEYDPTEIERELSAEDLAWLARERARDDAPNREPSRRIWLTSEHLCSPDCFTMAERAADPTIDAHYAMPHRCFDHDGMSGDCEATR